LFGTKTCSDAACAGHIHVLQWLRPQGCDWDNETLISAAAGFHCGCRQLGVRIRLRASGDGEMYAVCTLAAGHGDLEAFPSARAAGCPLSERAFEGAVRDAHLQVLRALFGEGCP
ncbi:unnamed protein product, partial [Phaeothamnion confervicola]